MLVNIFKSLYTVITAVNGKEGLEKTCSEMPHIVISDIIMPEMSGTELCLAIKQNFDTCHIPVVLLTAKTTIEHNLEGLKWEQTIISPNHLISIFYYQDAIISLIIELCYRRNSVNNRK